MSSEPPKPSESSAWPATAEMAAKAVHEWLTRPRVTLCVVGVLLAFGGLLLTNSVWTLPLVIVGALMVVVAWIGHRLEGRFAVEWGKTGTELAFRATVKPARAELPVVAASTAEPPPLTGGPAALDEQVIEGEAHTVEVDVGELKALIAAVETADPAVVATEQRQDIRVHRVVNPNGRSSEAPH